MKYLVVHHASVIRSSFFVFVPLYIRNIHHGNKQWTLHLCCWCAIIKCLLAQRECSNFSWLHHTQILHGLIRRQQDTNENMALIQQIFLSIETLRDPSNHIPLGKNFSCVFLHHTIMSINNSTLQNFLTIKSHLLLLLLWIQESEEQKLTILTCTNPCHLSECIIQMRHQEPQKEDADADAGKVWNLLLEHPQNLLWHSCIYS